MARYLTRVSAVLGLADSKKVTDRRTFLQDMQNIYQDENFVAAINDVSSKKFDGPTSWNEITVTVHRLILSEAEKPLGKAPRSNAAVLLQSSCCALMLRTVSLAMSTSTMTLNSADLMAIIFQILGNKIYESFQDTYMNILANHVLTNKMYRMEITSEQWGEILRLSMRMYKHSSDAYKSIVLDTVRLTVQYGCLQSHLLLDVKKMLPFLEKVFGEIGSGREILLKPIYKLTYVVCQQIGPESRIALCELSEKFLPQIVTLEGCPEKYEMMMLLVQIHHPGGASTKDDAAYACDWELWKNIIKGIYANIIRDVKAEKLSPCFLKLACEVYRQIMQDTSYVMDGCLSLPNEEYTQPHKRRRLSMAVQKPLDMLKDTNLENSWPYIQILTALLRKYPNSLKSNDYDTFLKTVMEFVTASLNKEKVMDSLCELCTVLVKVEKEHFHESHQNESVGDYWEKIWDTVLRALSMNQNEVYGHELLQSIIEHRSVLNSTAFLRLYLTNAIMWSSSSVQTLLTFCNYVPVPSELPTAGGTSAKPEFSIRESLIRWALEIPSSKLFTHIPSVTLANLLTGLTIKSWYKREFREAENCHDSPIRQKIADAEALESDLFDNREAKALNDIERCHLAMEFREKLFDDPAETKISEPKVRTLCFPEVLEPLIALLTASLNNRPSENDIGIFIKRTAVAAKLLSNFVEFDVRADSPIPRLETLFTQAFKKTIELLITINTMTCPYLVHILEALEVLYCTNYHWRVARMIVELSTIDFIKFIYELIPEDDDDDSCGDENSQSLYVSQRKMKDNRHSISSKSDQSDSCRIKNSAHKILTDYCCAWIGEDISTAQTRVLKNMMKIDIYEGTSSADLRRALRVVKAFGSSEKQLLTSEDCLDMSITFLKQLYDLRRKDETAVRGILNVLPFFVKVALKLRHRVDDLVKILRSIHNRLIEENSIFGPLVQADFVKCLAETLRLNPQLQWNPKISAESSPITDVLLAYIMNPFFLVRLETVRALHIVFSSKDLTVPWKLKYFTKIKSAVANLFVIDELPDGSGKTDELLTRTITAVHIYATIIHANEFLHSRALLAAIELSMRNEVKMSTLKKALLSVTRNESEQRRLVEIHLHYLLSHWFEADYPLQKFPYTLVDCDSLESFSKRYIETLLLIKLQRREFHHMQILCNNIDINFEETVENCFPSIMALVLSMSNSNKKDDETYGSQMYEFLRSNSDEFSKVKRYEELLEEKLSNVIVDLVKRLHDQDHFFMLFEIQVFLPKLNPPNLDTETVRHCFRSLERDLRVSGESIIEYLVIRHPSVLQKVLLTLICNIHEVNGADYKLQAFHQYAFFYTAVIEELSNPHFDHMSLYVVRDISHSLLAMIKEETKPLSEMACTYFSLFLKNSLPGRSEEIKKILSFAVSSLIPIVQAGKISGAMPILRFLIIDQQEVLGEAIKKLDSFPNEESFAEIKKVHHRLKYCNGQYSLEDEIEHFLNATHEKTLSCSFEGLSHVRNQLSTRKSELRAMYSELEGLRGFAEDCALSTLHRLVYKLVQLTRSSDANVSLEAAKCLGELGPADLTTMILHPENGYRREDIDNEVPMLTLKVVSHLADYMIENNMELRKASADALYTIFATSWGQELFMRKTFAKEFDPIYDHVYPFGVKKISKHKAIHIDRVNWAKCIDSGNDLWIPVGFKAYSKWIIEITCRLLDCFVNLYTKSLKPVCRLSVEFCESLLPRLVNMIERLDGELAGDVCVVIDRFFGSLFDSSKEADHSTIVPDSPVKRDVGRSYECVRCMLNVVNFMRIQSIDNYPVALNYLLIAKAAQYCSAYFTSVLYAELWCESFLEDSGLLADKMPGSWISAIDAICESKPDTGKLLQDIVREAYLRIGDPDSIYGCGLSHLTDSSFRTQHYIHLRQWDKVLLAQDVDMSCGNTSIRGMLNALQQSGLQSLLGRMINTVNRDVENVDDFMYEAAWRLSDWSIIEPHRGVDCTTENSNALQSIENTDYHAAHYRALKCLCDSDIVGLKSAVDNGRASIVKSLRNMSLECSQTVYPILSQLQLLREIEEFATKKSDKYDELFDSWHQQNFSNTHDFKYVEPILSQRLVMFRTKNFGETIVNMRHALIKTHLEIAEIAEKQGYFPIAARSLDTLMKTNDLSKGALDQVTYHHAVLAWKRNDQDIGRYGLRNLIKKPSMNPSLRAKTLRVYGNWMAETKSENPQAVIEKYYKESIKTSESITRRSLYDLNNLTDAQGDLAQFADAQYQQIIEFMKSPQYESLVECSSLRNEMKSTSASARNHDERRAMLNNQKAMINDAAELEEINGEKEMYLALATRYYLLALQHGNRHDLLVFRLVSLWLENMFHEQLNGLLGESIDRVASYKFITLLPQLAPHMSNERTVFTTKINSLMRRCATEHPHHTLPVLLALKNTYKDLVFQPSEKGAPRRKEKNHTEARIIAAEELIMMLAETPIRPIIQEMSQLSDALIMLAYWGTSDAEAKKTGQKHNIPQNQMITRVRNYEHINVPTMTLDVRSSGNYSDVIGIREYATNYEIPGGVCAPKKITCIGTDGIKRIQLVKGRDDLRQDAVMQQVCIVMNSMLKASKETKRRKLHIRTYKIVPLSQRSGVLEWCENTSPISSILCDGTKERGLHSKYYPNDWTVTQCRSKLRDVEKASSDVKLKTFLECCKNLHPAFHHFFMENYPSAETWFERRLAYTRSVATTSMVGYMLGLGDRHFSNILIDRTTAEVVHIDFGIAFAQGKVLPIPETVPFRLTRDMEVAMGICGVEGVMRRSCEETTTVLRDRRKILITLLQVLLYDPLFSWAITPVRSEGSCKNARYSGREAGQKSPKKTNKIAERALLRIEQKLQGTEDGLVSSISGQVERLIQQARDPANLCRLYSGWQPYL